MKMDKASLTAFGLSKKQELIARAYSVTLDAAKAFRLAFPHDTTTDSGATRVVNTALKNKKVAARVFDLLQARAEFIELKVDDVLAELKKIAFSNINDFVEVKEGVTAMRKEIDPLTKKPINVKYVYQTVRIKASAKMNTGASGCIQEMKYSPDGVFAIKLHSKLAALEMLGKHVGMFSADINVNVKDAGDIGKAIEVLGEPVSDAVAMQTYNDCLT